ncbi:hypothetical protein, partial [Planktothrix agardhii]|uniref:hypothetical protein n=1 Tax=Planktothrix agardhii TaxID=1160 RepID=UPI001F17019D
YLLVNLLLIIRIYESALCHDGGEFRGGVSTVGKLPSQGVDSESLAVVIAFLSLSLTKMMTLYSI